MLVIVLLLCMLCLEHHFTSLFNQISDLSEQIIMKEYRQRCQKQDQWAALLWISMHKHKRRVTSAYIDCCVDCHLDIWQFGKPSTMFLIQQKLTQYLLGCSMLVFSISITLWMVSSRMKCFVPRSFQSDFQNYATKYGSLSIVIV